MLVREELRLARPTTAVARPKSLGFAGAYRPASPVVA